jgi:cardiolipin synthase (CMP-forming)
MRPMAILPSTSAGRPSLARISTPSLTRPLVSIYLTLGFTNHLPVWLLIAVVSRDILISGAFILAWMLSRPITIRPLLVSKANTLAQLVLASLVLAELGLGLGLAPFVTMCIWVTGALTILSATVYFWVWLKHMTSYEPQPAHY